MMGWVKVLVELVHEYGLVAVLLAILVLIVHDPDRALKLKVLLLGPLFRWFKWGSRSFIAARVAYTSTVFFREQVTGLAASIKEIKIRVKWVKNPSDPVLSKDGTLILRLKATNDQTRNVMMATRVALPYVVCPTLRRNLQHNVESGIDLTLLHDLAQRLGKHAHPIFQRHFFDPEVRGDSSVVALFEKLVVLDDFGVFVPIFLEELTLLGERLYAEGNTHDQTPQVLSFLDFLLVLARKEIGEDIPLEYHSAHLRVGILLLAISSKAQVEGVPPYINRIDKKLKSGCDSIYVVAYPSAGGFLKRVLNAIEGDLRVSFVAHHVVRKSWREERKGGHISEIAMLCRNSLFTDVVFEERVKALGLQEGDSVEGMVMDVAEVATLVDVAGMNAVITRKECSWQRVKHCGDVVTKDSRRKFIVKQIDTQRQQLTLSLRDPASDPWKSECMPTYGDTISVEVVDWTGCCIMSRYDDEIEVEIPMEEVSWSCVSRADVEGLLGTRQDVVIYEISEEEHVIRGSIIRALEDPWPEIHKACPKGAQLRATVVEVRKELVRVKLPNGLIGIVPSESMIRGGYEYVDFENTVVPGQGLDVVVSKVFLGKRKIRLELKRGGEDKPK